MNTKLRKALADKCKDFGLTDKALDELANLGSDGITDETSDEDITKKVDSLVPFAKAMQGEITRKTSKSQSKKTTSATGEEGEGEGEGDKGKAEGKEIPSWMEEYMKPIKESLNNLKSENAALKAEKAASERRNLIETKAKELGIPAYLTKRLSFADDADIEAELKSYKQELVSNNLMPKDAALESGKVEDAMKSDAKTWAASLPNQ